MLHDLWVSDTPQSSNTGRDLVTGRFLRGAPSANPKGRPRAGLALAERIRERFDPDTIIDLASRLAADETLSVSSRLAALLPFVQLGYVKPPSGVAIDMTTRQTNAREIGGTLEQRKQVLAQIQALRALDGHRVQDPKVLDGESTLSPAAVALSVALPDEE